MSKWNVETVVEISFNKVVEAKQKLYAQDEIMAHFREVDNVEDLKAVLDELNLDVEVEVTTCTPKKIKQPAVA